MDKIEKHHLNVRKFNRQHALNRLFFICGLVTAAYPGTSKLYPRNSGYVATRLRRRLLRGYVVMRLRGYLGTQLSSYWSA